MIGKSNLTNNVTVTSNQTGDKEFNASNYTTLLVPNMTVEKIVVDKVVLNGTEVTFTINVTNTGSANLTNVTIHEVPGVGLSGGVISDTDKWKLGKDNRLELN